MYIYIFPLFPFGLLAFQLSLLVGPFGRGFLAMWHEIRYLIVNRDMSGWQLIMAWMSVVVRDVVSIVVWMRVHVGSRWEAYTLCLRRRASDGIRVYVKNTLLKRR